MEGFRRHSDKSCTISAI